MPTASVRTRTDHQRGYAAAIEEREPVERDHWSASELASELPAGHAVLSLTAATGESAPPLLIDLRT